MFESLPRVLSRVHGVNLQNDVLQSKHRILKVIFKRKFVQRQRRVGGNQHVVSLVEQRLDFNHILSTLRIKEQI